MKTPWTSWAIVGVFVTYLGWVFMPVTDATDAWQFRAFGRLPVQEGGRLQPIDTLARNKLTILSLPIMNGYQSYRDDENNKYSAVEWLLQVVTAEVRLPRKENNPDMDRKIFRIDHPAMLRELGLAPRENYRYSFNEFGPQFGQFLNDINASLNKPEEKRDAREKSLAELDEVAGIVLDGMKVAFMLLNLNQKVIRIESEQVVDLFPLPHHRPGLRYSASEFMEGLEAFMKEAKRVNDTEPKKRNQFDTKILEVYRNFGSLVTLARMEEFYVIPPTDRGSKAWLTLQQAGEMEHHARKMGAGGENKYLIHVAEALQAYQKDEKKAFNKAVEKCHEALAKTQPGLAGILDLECYFNEAAPFFHLFVLNIVIFVMCCVSWIHWFPTLNRASFWATALVVLVSTWALIIRMYIQGRPPVTNLYSSAIFIGWGCSWVCLLAEYFYRNSIALTVGSICGGLSLLVANYLGMSGDTLGSLEAVLDTNFWLATHVTTITLGYTAAFVAGFMGICYVILGLFTDKLRGVDAKALSNVLYGVICFAMFLSFTGTVLGGIWADQSWGRFWGWDPKENGALLLVLWNALILHARWGGMVKARGIALLAIFGNCITAWSWFGTNLLGVGLHSYGFMQGAMVWLLVFCISQLGFIALGLIPMKYWASFAPKAKTLSDRPPLDLR